jgi:hypothetical protein
MRNSLTNVLGLLAGVLIVIQVPSCSAEDLESFSTVVHMQERDLPVTVYYYAGEEEWGNHIFNITVEALPILEDLAGFPYPHEYDVVIYPKRSRDTRGWNAQNNMREGIWINRDRFTPEIITYWAYTAVIIHENVHYWSNDAIYEKPWLKEGYAELFAHLALERMGRKEDALHRKNEWFFTVDVNRYYDIPLDTFEYETSGPGNETTFLAYSKSALFCYEIYERYGIEPIQKINDYLYRNGVTADSFAYMNLLEEYTRKDQEELFMEWVFPKRIDLGEWESAENKISELKELADSWLSYVEEEYGLHRILDFVEFQMHVGAQIKEAQSFIEEYDFERAVKMMDEEIEKINSKMAEFEGHALSYAEAEEYYNTLGLGKIPADKLSAAKESLFSFDYDLFTEQLGTFYEEMETLETYQNMYHDWCTEGCTSLDSLDELFSCSNYEQVVSEISTIVDVFQEYEATEKMIDDSDWFTRLGVYLSKNKGDFESDLEDAKEALKNGNSEDAFCILARIRGELSKTRMYGIGILVGVLGAGVALFLVIKKERGHL